MINVQTYLCAIVSERKVKSFRIKTTDRNDDDGSGQRERIIDTRQREATQNDASSREPHF